MKYEKKYYIGDKNTGNLKQVKSMQQAKKYINELDHQNYGIVKLSVSEMKIHIALDSYFFFERDNFQKIKDYLDEHNVDSGLYKILPFSHEIQPGLPKNKKQMWVQYFTNF